MRRFSIMILSLAVLFAVVIGRKDHGERQNAAQPASSNGEGLRPAETPGAAASEPSGAGPGESIVPVQSAPDGALLKTAATLARPDAAQQTEKSGFITSAPAHIQASAKSAAIDPALEGLTGADLNSAAQGELKRLGCYDAKVDGKWGRKTEAAVKAFGERAGGEWTKAPRRDLVSALRNYPAAFCATECAAKTAGGQCAAVSAPKAIESGEAGKDKSYLPPWMQDAKLTTGEQPATAAPDVAPATTSKPRKSKSVRRRGGDGGRSAQRYERRRVGNSRDWLPNGWPGAR